MRYLLLVLLTACGATSSTAIPEGDAAQCEPGARTSCECSGRAGWSTCTTEAKRGGCDCGSSNPPPVEEDAGELDASCATPTAFYRDVDGDGFGSGVPTPACARPDGYADVDGDCDDTDARAYPGQKAYFTTARPGGSFDFDCTGTPEKQYVAIGNCDFVGGSCIGIGTGGFWATQPEPACGAAASWVIECLTGCGMSNEQRTQGCR